MGRWKPDARSRLVVAAVELFSKQGYEMTTIAQIVEHAGLTKSTFFRHFPDKRELLSAGQETLCALLAEGILQAPPDATPLAAVSVALVLASTAMGPANRDMGPLIKAAIESSVELQERAALKNVAMAKTMSAALINRGVADATAELAGDLGVLAFKRAFAAWAEGGSEAGDKLAPHVEAAIDELRASTTELLR